MRRHRGVDTAAVLWYLLCRLLLYFVLHECLPLGDLDPNVRNTIITNATRRYRERGGATPAASGRKVNLDDPARVRQPGTECSSLVRELGTEDDATARCPSTSPVCVNARQWWLAVGVILLTIKRAL